jgi:putative tryptophan/tyrosine transport system substrate-binding protein
VVFVLVSDPVAQGFADSLTKSGGNLTGFSRYEFSVGGNWLGLLKEIVRLRAGCGVVQPRDVAAVQILPPCDRVRRVIVS